ncbi:MAG: PEP-CTERM sorting domain-containing protein [Acidobacteriaceae bacterium]|nr:PEP-CTERM sorting domain-containing protein [Acidobacteriaceae bacterium]
MKHSRGVWSLVGLWLAGCLGAPADPLYSVVNLGALGTGAAMPTAVNGAGVVSGVWTDPSGQQQAVSFNGQPTPQTLGWLGQANGVNDTGTFIGTSLANNSPSVVESSGGQVKSLGISGYGTAINNAGQIGGGMITANGQVHAFLWSSGSLLDVGTLTGATWSSVYGINSSGQAVGTSMAGNGTTSVFVSNGTSVQAIANTLGGASAHGMSINDSGTVVGNAQTSSRYPHAFLSSGQGMVDLGTLGGTQSYAYGINDAGLVVGYSLLSDNTTHAFAYLGGVLVDLNTWLPASSGWTLGAAYAVNNSGDIVGVGTLNNQLYAVELVPSGPPAIMAEAPADPAPVPEPGALLLSATGLAAIATIVWRRRRAAGV